MYADQQTIRVFLADDRTILRAGLRKLFEREPDIRVVGEAANGTETIRLVNETDPDLLLINLQLPGLPGIEVLRQLSAQGHGVRALLLAGVEDEGEVAEAFRQGARGVVLKDSDTKVLIQGIRSVAGGKFWLGRRQVVRLGKTLPRLSDLSSAGAHQRTFGLTRRERDIVAAIVSGYSNREIAQKFSITEDTVKHHLTNIFDKAGVYNRLELALFAIHHGLTGRR